MISDLIDDTEQKYNTEMVHNTTPKRHKKTNKETNLKKI